MRAPLLTACLAALLGATLPASAHDVVAPASGRVGAARTTPLASYDVPLAGDGQQVIVQGTFNDSVSGPMLVDTGSSYCVLTRATARRLGLRPRASIAIPVATANGEVAAGLVTLSSVKIASARLATVDAVIMDAVEPPLVGIIGLSFLRSFRYSVDHAAGRFRLER